MDGNRALNALLSLAPGTGSPPPRPEAKEARYGRGWGFHWTEGPVPAPQPDYKIFVPFVHWKAFMVIRLHLFAGFEGSCNDFNSQVWEVVSKTKSSSMPITIITLYIFLFYYALKLSLPLVPMDDQRKWQSGMKTWRTWSKKKNIHLKPLKSPSQSNQQ